MNTKFVKLATDDYVLIKFMVGTIEYQHKVITKREKLVYAIKHNVKYLMSLQRGNAAYQRHLEIKITETEKRCETLTEDNEKLIKERDRLMKA